MSATRTEWHLQLRDSRGFPGTLRDDTGKVVVLNSVLPTAPTLYSDENGTVITGPMTLAGGGVHFYTDITVALVDLVILTALGQARFVKGFTPSQQHIDIDAERVRQMLVIPFGPTNAVEVDTGLDLPAGCALSPLDLVMKVVGTDSAKTIDLGFLSTESSGDPNGIVAAGVLTAAGYIDMKAKLGALINSSTGPATELQKYVTAAVNKRLSYTPSSGSTTCTGYFGLVYDLVP